MKITTQLKIISIKIDLHIRQYWLEYCLYTFLLIVSLFLRLYQLGNKAMHHDESLHSFYAWVLSESFTLIHNPMMHGPLQMDLTAIIFRMFGDSDFTARFLYALVGTALIFTPLLFKDSLGKSGTILVSTMLGISPTMVYFSRFARNDILMAFLAILMFACLWKYKHTGKSKYLYWCSGFLAASYGTKETAFLISGILVLYLLSCWLIEKKHTLFASISLEKDTYPQATINLTKSFTSHIRLGWANMTHSRNLSFAIFIGALILPQWTAFLGLLQNTPLFSWSEGTLISGIDSSRIGMPSGGRIIGYIAGTEVSASTLLATALVIFTISIASYVGYNHFGRIWIRCALIFYSIWISIYTTFLTNFPDGISSGIWQSLGYWIVQQGEGRGGQPFYYYFIITPLYEYLPLFLCIPAIIYYRKKKGDFSSLLIYWTLSTFVIYTIASEKMPWLLVNISLPLILLGGKFLGELIEEIEWNSVIKSRNILWVLLVPMISVTLFSLIQMSGSYPEPLPVIIALLIIGLLSIGLYKVVKARTWVKYPTQISLTLIGAAMLLMILTFRTTFITNFQNPDIPVEMMVYTQTSPDILTISREIRSYTKESEDNSNYFEAPISIDPTSGFSWPWTWYFRHYKNVDYSVYNDQTTFSAKASEIALVHSDNHKVAENQFPEELYREERVAHRWWFPEHKYRDISILEMTKMLVNIKAWKPFANYWFNRRSLAHEIGSEDVFLYVPVDFPKLNLVNDKIRNQ